MALTDQRQRSVPILYIVIAAVLLAARIISAQFGAHEDADSLVKWVPLEQAQPLAARSGKPILYDFTAAWCVPCRDLDRQVFRDPRYARAINERFIAVRITDRQQEDGRNVPAIQELEQRFFVRGFPTVIVADANGSALARMEGFRGPEEFARVMETAH
ncbi:MAG TPA: thioredoxin fold domain-containing protein [Thermoanaerobaculia bacterium]|nr:thioredoxin fold domain-containing protein [Thermoanaerobaculia bacterium]